MISWLTNFIEENQEKWEHEREERKNEFNKKIQDWDKKDRLQKIRKNKERASPELGQAWHQM